MQFQTVHTLVLEGALDGGDTCPQELCLSALTGGEI